MSPTPPARAIGMARPAGALIRDLCSIAVALGDARDPALVIFDDTAAELAARLVAAGLECRVDPAAAARCTQTRPHALPTDPGQPSDQISLALPLVVEDRLLGCLELHAARPDALTRHHRAVLAALADRIAASLADLLMAGSPALHQMIALVDALSDHDDEAASRVLTGLLQLAAGGAPSMVEVTALRIAGLAEMAGARVVLTAEGQGVLARAGLAAARPAEGIRLPDQAEALRRLTLSHWSQPEWKPFARLSIAQTEFEIAEASDYDPIVFRPVGSGGDWVELRHGLIDGWTEIAAEILGETHDVLAEFARMHMIRRRDVSLDEVAEVYGLGALTWMLRETETGFEIRSPDSPWQALDMAGQTLDKQELRNDRSHAVLALMQLWPDLAERISHDLRSWVRRMATGAKITPLMAPVVA